MPEARILVVEDDLAHAEVLQDALERDGHVVELAADADAALDRLRARDFDLVVTDLMLGGRDGLELLAAIKEILPDLSVMLVTGYGSVETAVRAMRAGATDYLTKPINLVELRTRVERELEKRRLAADNEDLRRELDRRYGLEGVIGNAPPMKAVFDVVRQAGRTDATVLVLGESGTGKELIARALHRLSPRARRRFVAINCAALTETLIESELFGHVKGAFTGAQSAKEGKFEYANGGTLFLDEIGDMPLATQAKLLRVLENREVVPVGANEARPVDVRIVAATNRDLLERVQQGAFREDLYYRLAVISVVMPPLRERLDDLPVLAEHFVREFREAHGKEVRGIDAEVLLRFRAHPWPGNVRELRNALETMVVLDGDGRLGVDDLPMGLRHLEAAPLPTAPPAGAAGGDASSVAAPATAAAADAVPGGYVLAGRSLAEVERDLLAATLELTAGNRQKAARLLGMGERTLYRKIKEFGLGSP